jgi:hypothetical protein
MKISDSNAITGSIQRFVKTPQGTIINAMYYDKSKKIPKPFKLFTTLGDTSDISMSKKLMINHTLVNHCKTQGDTIVVDSSDITISYVWVISTRSNTLRLMKIKEDSGDVTLLNSVSYSATPTANAFPRSYCSQDSNYLYYIMSCAGTYHEYLVKVDKTSLAMTTVEDYTTYAWGSHLLSNTSHIYHARKQGYGTNIIKRYNKSTAIMDVFAITAKTSNIYFSSCFSDILKISDTEFYTFSLFHNQTTNKFGITRYHFDTTQSTLATICTEADSTITWGATVTQFPVFASNASMHYEPFITTTSDSKQYLNIAIYENSNTSTATNLTSLGIYTFLLDMTNNALTFKSFVQPTVDYFRGFHGIKNNTYLVCGSPTSSIFMSFDTVNEKFVIADTISNQANHIGIDQSEGIWIAYSDTSVEYLTPTIPTYVNVKFEKQSADYDGTDINTYLTINCINYSNAYIEANIQLTLSGDVVFTDNNSKVITVKTLTTGDLKVPFIVKGKKSVTVDAKLVM